MKKRILLTLALVLTLLMGTVALVIGVSANSEAPALEINGANISFEGSVHLIYSVGYEKIASPENIKLLVWREAEGIHVDNLKKGTEKYVLSKMTNPPDNLPDGSVAFEFEGVSAAEMTENIYVKAYYIEDGEEIYSPARKYSVLQYALNMLGITGQASDTESFKNMLRGMLEYGALAQQHYGVLTDRLANDNYVKIKTIGTEFDDGTTSSLVKRGESVTLAATVSDELPFAVWVDEEGIVLSESSSYTFTADKNMSISVMLLSEKTESLLGAFVKDERPDLYMQFNGNLNVSGKAPVGSLQTGDLTFDSGRDGKENGSAFFGGEDYITFDDLKLGAGDYSLALWIKPTDLSFGNSSRYKIPIVSTSTDLRREIAGMNILIDTENGSLVTTLGDAQKQNGVNAYAYFFTPSSKKATDNPDRYSGLPLYSELEGEWIHIAVSVDRTNGTIKMYVNFEVILSSNLVYFGTSNKIPADISVDAADFTVGQYGLPKSGSQELRAYIDELAVFTRAITEADVEKLENFYQESGNICEHTFSEEWSYDDGKHWHASVCGHDVRADEAEHFIGADGACVSNCGYVSAATHTHTYSSTWSSDDTGHWHAANCEHRELTIGFEPHDYEQGIYCTVCGYARSLTIDPSDIEQGGFAYGTKTVNTKRIRVNRLIHVKKGTVIRYNLGELELYLDLADGDGLSTGDRVGWLKGSGEYVIGRDAYLGITIAKGGRTASIVSSDYTADITLIPGAGEIEMDYNTVNVYKYGGDGNDWCFVYFPVDYDSNRSEPYPFVIANHGNGWVMDGSIQKANWTNIGQYMSASEIANQPENLQSRFIATDDEKLWYSNPTIEALRSAGYIVAGAQNYGDGLYGNDNCTDACAEFFNHILETYNVEDSCYMIGASNGAMTTLNTAAKLGDKVKAIILQYPLTSIISQYTAGNHQDSIESAYGLDVSKTYTKSELEELISEYDPLYKNVTDGVKDGYFPPVKIYYSMTDTTTPADANALPLIAMLEKSDIVYEAIQVDADGVKKQHGHIDHFDPDGFVEWFDNNG